MLGRFRSALYNAIGNLEEEESPTLTSPKVKYPYQRPIFLQLFSNDEIQVTADHLVRPIIVPRDVTILPWYSGYAEAINAGKSAQNEDQAVFHRGILRPYDISNDNNEDNNVKTRVNIELPYVYFGIFDGHAGPGCAVSAANELHQIIHNRLLRVLHHLISPLDVRYREHEQESFINFRRDISIESLVIGALESAFAEMDHGIGEDKKRYKVSGGCTVLVSLFILGKLYVANAGDSRAVFCRHQAVYPMSFDFTPVSERQRLQQLGYQKPHLLGSEYTHLDFCRRPMKNDLGKTMLYRDAHMTGWTYKEINQQDLKFPVVYGEGKRSRLLATIGVTRGFGDHDLRAQCQDPGGGSIYIKPFLLSQPEVRVIDLEAEDSLTGGDVLIMATDGLWDVISNEKAAEIVTNGSILSVNEEDTRKKYRYISIAQDLVMAARGKLVDRSWIKDDNDNNKTSATIDDISVFVIPVVGYKQEYESWKKEMTEKNKRKRTKSRETEDEDDDDEDEDEESGDK